MHKAVAVAETERLSEQGDALLLSRRRREEDKKRRRDACLGFMLWDRVVKTHENGVNGGSEHRMGTAGRRMCKKVSPTALITRQSGWVYLLTDFL